ncbi:VPLPA-CTERM sorting domain-containing protein [Sneathiella sp.]|uniref:VPLPA-CTERM sorting domain-containing protein n=1 Tax=Sneathiella sp. TaxID=1964365 RepID=UPI003564DED4
MKSLLTGIAAAAVLTFAAVGAQASTTFNFGGNGGLAASYAFSEDGIGLTATPGEFQSSTIGSETVSTPGAARVGQYAGGLGVSNPWYFDQHEVDGLINNDVVIFSFDQKVSLETVAFTYFDDEVSWNWKQGWHSAGNDEFSGFLDTDNDGLLNLVGINFDANPFNAGGIIGKLFGIGAWDNNDDFKIKSMTVSAVPLPAALPLYGAGLAVMGFVGWRKRRKAAAQA